MTLEVAIDMKSLDFEDDIQIACALAGGAESIITRDPAGFAGAPIPVITPAQAGERLGIA